MPGRKLGFLFGVTCVGPAINAFKVRCCFQAFLNTHFALVLGVIITYIQISAEA